MRKEKIMSHISINQRIKSKYSKQRQREEISETVRPRDSKDREKGERETVRDDYLSFSELHRNVPYRHERV